MQVAWLGSKEKLTWELASTLPSGLIEEYEEGMCPHEATLSENKYGEVNHTLILERHRSPNSSEPEAKKPKLNQKWDERYTENK